MAKDNQRTKQPTNQPSNPPTFLPTNPSPKPFSCKATHLSAGHLVIFELIWVICVELVGLCLTREGIPLNKLKNSINLLPKSKPPEQVCAANGVFQIIVTTDPSVFYMESLSFALVQNTSRVPNQELLRYFWLSIRQEPVKSSS